LLPKKVMQRLIEKTDFKNLTILTLVNLIIGIYLISTMVLISKDGTLYINCARQFTTHNPISVISNIETAPGYPFLIFLIHKFIDFFTNNNSLQRWILSAQMVSLFSKLVGSVFLYYIGTLLLDQKKFVFWGILILNILPDSAEYGSDALTEWPHLMFLSIGFLLLLCGAQYRKSQMFGLAGITTGLGYLVRSESCQLLIYGGIWLLFNLVRPTNRMKRPKAAVALLLMAVGFIIIAAPYMKIKGYAFPKQRMLRLSETSSVSDNVKFVSPTSTAYTGEIMGNKTIMKNIFETLVYYFVPGLFIGCWHYFRKQSKRIEQGFFAAAFIILNVMMLLWQQNYQHFISRRHTLPLIVFTMFCVPIGMQIISDWISERTSRGKSTTEKNRRNWYYILIALGVTICFVKLIKHTSSQKSGYRDAAMWLNKNTTPEDIIAVPDKRITYYAERNGMEYSDERQISKRVNYIIRVVKENDVTPSFGRNIEEKYLTWIDKENSRKLVIYKVLR